MKRFIVVVIVKKIAPSNHVWNAFCRDTKEVLSQTLGIPEDTVQVCRNATFFPGTLEEAVLTMPDRGLPVNHNAVFALQHCAQKYLDIASVRPYYLVEPTHDR